MGGACSTNGGKRNAYRILVGKSEGKRPLGRPRRTWVNNIKMDPIEIGWDGVDWIDMAQYRDQWRALVNTVLKIRVLQNAGKFLSGYTTGGSSRVSKSLYNCEYRELLLMTIFPMNFLILYSTACRHIYTVTIKVIFQLHIAL
jgi:hypothetical protein